MRNLLGDIRAVSDYIIGILGVILAVFVLHDQFPHAQILLAVAILVFVIVRGLAVLITMFLPRKSVSQE